MSFFSSTQDVFDHQNKKLIDAMKLMQFFNALGVFIIPSILFLHFRGLKFCTYLKLNSSVYIKGVLTIFVMAIAMIPVANFFGAVNAMLPLPKFLSFLKDIEAQTLLITEQFLVMDTPIDLLLMLALIGFVAAVGEELLFRGVLQNLFQEWFGSPHIAVWLTAFLFSVIHLQYHALLPRFVLGALIGYVYVYSGNLRSAMLLHFFITVHWCCSLFYSAWRNRCVMGRSRHRRIDVGSCISTCIGDITSKAYSKECHSTLR